MANEELLTLYQTATEMMRHFHSQLDRHRLVVVTVGLIVLAASGKLLLDSRNPLMPACVSLFGFLFVVSIWLNAHHMRSHTADCIYAAAEAEKRLCEITGTTSETMQKMAIEHRNLLTSNFKNSIWGISVRYGTFLVMALGCFTVFTYSVVLWLR